MRWALPFQTYIIGILLALSACLPATAQADIAQTCNSLDRPNIDCACVATRVATFRDYAPTEDAKRMIEETYLRETGQDNDFETVAERVLGDGVDPIDQVAVISALDPLGGVPTNIEDMEQGCVVKGARPVTIKAPRDIIGSNGFSTDAYVKSCMNGTGGPDGGRRYCQCTAERLTHRLSDIEFEATAAGILYDEDMSWSTTDEKLDLIKDGMNISRSRLDRLRRQASSKTKPFEDQDIAYCTSRIWADQRAGQTAEERQLAGFDPELLTTPAITTQSLDDLPPLEQARQIISQSCKQDGNSAAYCQCYRRDFETRVVDASPSHETALAWALMNGGSALSSADYMRLTQSLDSADHQSAGMMMMQTMDLGETCSQGRTEAPEPLGGTPSERMNTICIAENEDHALCQCLTSQMQDRLSADDFELLVDLREAEHLGAADPLATVAEDRGLSKAEAEKAMMMNQSMMGGIMGMDMMACMGGMPDMSNLPGFPGLPRQ